MSSVATEHTNPSAPARAGARCGVVAPAVLAAVGDPDGTRRITAIVALLVALGVGLVMLAIWLFRVTRPDPEVLAPLELMGDRTWRRADPVWQRRRLDEVRPDGAEPLQPSVAPPEIDEAFDAGPAVSGFDDLHDVPVEALPITVLGDPLLSGPSNVSPADATSALARDERRRSGPATLPPPQLPQRPRVNLVDPRAPATPTGIERPTPDDMPAHEIDPALMASALAELDAELRSRREGADDRATRPGE